MQSPATRSTPIGTPPSGTGNRQVPAVAVRCVLGAELCYASRMKTDVIEVVPGKVSGVPIVKGTRIPVSAIMDNFNAGVSPAEIADLYDGLDVETVKAVIKEARAPRPA